MDAVRIAEIRDKADAATPGPWFSDGLNGVWNSEELPYREDGIIVASTSETRAVQVQNAAFIAEANPATVTELLDALEQAQRERDEARKTAESLAHSLKWEVRGSMYTLIEEHLPKGATAWEFEEQL